MKKELETTVKHNDKKYKAVREEKAGFCTGCDLRKVNGCKDLFGCYDEDRMIYKEV